jgi:glycosyltransferase involved in cell wall biosynthesis
MARFRLAIVASHVIQYQDPFFRLLGEQRDIELEVLYCSLQGAESYRDEDMAATLRWDVDLLKGYRYRALRNLSPESSSGFFRAVNPGIVPAITRGNFDAVVFMLGWGTLTSLMGMLACRIAQVPFLLYGDSSFPAPEVMLRSRIRSKFLRSMFAVTSGFMVSGVLNAAYYEHYGGKRERFFLLPWAVDNQRFAAAADLSAEARERLRASYGIQAHEFTIVFSAKLVARKDPMTLLKAVATMENRNNVAVLFLGDGLLRSSLEQYAREKRVHAVFAGFVNQVDLPKHYAIGDVFVLPSTYEPRGAVVNEAMACGLPVVVTDRCGSIGDIVLHEDNAFVFPAGDEHALASALDQLAENTQLLDRMRNRSKQIIADWNFQRGVEGVRRALAFVREHPK